MSLKQKSNNGCKVLIPAPKDYSLDWMDYWGRPPPYKQREYIGPIDQSLIDQYKKLRPATKKIR